MNPYMSFREIGEPTKDDLIKQALGYLHLEKYRSVINICLDLITLDVREQTKLSCEVEFAERKKIRNKHKKGK